MCYKVGLTDLKVRNIVKTVLKDHLWDKDNVTLYDR